MCDEEGEIMNETTTITPGRYRHYKGNEYSVLGVARHSETREELVVYRQEYGDHSLWVRPKQMFLATVKSDGKEVPRFRFVGLVEKSEMMPELLNAYRHNLDWIHRLVADLNEDQMVCQPGRYVNHPTWTIGHLVHSCEQIGGEMGTAPWLSADWAERFATGSKPVADRNAYSTKAALLLALDDGHRRLSERLALMTPTELHRPLPDVWYQQVFPAIGYAVLHILVSHTATHIGQITAWRRAMRLQAIPEMLV
jgi:hypothetical protein